MTIPDPDSIGQATMKLAYAVTAVLISGSLLSGCRQSSANNTAQERLREDTRIGHIGWQTIYDPDNNQVATAECSDEGLCEVTTFNFEKMTWVTTSSDWSGEMKALKKTLRDTGNDGLDYACYLYSGIAGLPIGDYGIRSANYDITSFTLGGTLPIQTLDDPPSSVFVNLKTDRLVVTSESGAVVSADISNLHEFNRRSGWSDHAEVYCYRVFGIDENDHPVYLGRMEGAFTVVNDDSADTFELLTHEKHLIDKHEMAFIYKDRILYKGPHSSTATSGKLESMPFKAGQHEPW